LKINITELQNQPEGQMNIVFQEAIKELESEVPIDAVLKLTATTFGVNVSGHVTTELKLACDRCLQEFTFHVDVDVNEDFVSESVVPPDKKEYELKERQFVEELDGKDEIDITDFLYQIVILEIPTQKICKDACKGSEEYQKIISEKYIDERLEVFKSFSENRDKNNQK